MRNDAQLLPSRFVICSSFVRYHNMSQHHFYVTLYSLKEPLNHVQYGWQWSKYILTKYFLFFTSFKWSFYQEMWRYESLNTFLLFLEQHNWAVWTEPKGGQRNKFTGDGRMIVQAVRNSMPEVFSRIFHIRLWFLSRLSFKPFSCMVYQLMYSFISIVLFTSSVSFEPLLFIWRCLINYNWRQPKFDMPR